LQAGIPLVLRTPTHVRITYSYDGIAFCGQVSLPPEMIEISKLLLSQFQPTWIPKSSLRIP